MLQQADDAVAPGKSRFVSIQNHYNLLNRADESEVLPLCQRLGSTFRTSPWPAGC